MAGFGDDFDETAFRTAHASSDPDDLNRVKAVERGVDQLFNYVAELTAFGLELAHVRRRDAELNARRDLDDLRRHRVLSADLVEKLQQLREIRRLLVHEYSDATAAQIHQAAWIVVDAVPAFSARTCGGSRRASPPTALARAERRHDRDPAAGAGGRAEGGPDADVVEAAVEEVSRRRGERSQPRTKAPEEPPTSRPQARTSPER